MKYSNCMDMGMIEVTYYYSACVGLKTSDITILCDPWFTEGIYDGSWYHYPPVNDPFSLIERYEYIYVSHIHPDHYDVAFLHKYLLKYPDTKIIIADFSENFLSKKMKSDGIPHSIWTEHTVSETSIRLFPQSIDSALAIKKGKQSVLNLNDSWYNKLQFDQVISYLGSPDIALLSHAGAGAYPQTYYEINDPVLLEKANWKHDEMLKRYLKMKEVLNPKITIPFAGQYILGGKLHYLNSFRGVSDPVEVLQIDPNAIVLAEEATINTENLQPTEIRSNKFPRKDIQQYALQLASKPMDYEVTFADLDSGKPNWEKLTQTAYENALRRLNVDCEAWHCIKLPNQWFCMKVNKTNPECHFLTTDEIHKLSPRVETYIDYRYLYGLLNRVYHWNNGEIGSQYFTRRIPDNYNQTVQSFLYFFHV